MGQLISLRCKNCGDLLLEKGGQFVCPSCCSVFMLETDLARREDFQIIAGVLKQYTGLATVVTIPAEVKIIGKDCFRGLESLESVGLPEGLSKIEESAFQDCKSLKYLSLPSSLTHIGPCAFKNAGLKDLFLPSSLIEVGRDAFMECAFLETVTLPSAGRIRYERTFKQCSSLKSVEGDLSAFCFSFYPSTEARKRGDERPTLFDAFQATPFFIELRDKVRKGECLNCGARIGSNGICSQCGEKYVDKMGGCYVATAVYGSYDCPPVWTLRRYRDQVLFASRFGSLLIRIYYRFSPDLIERFGKYDIIRSLSRKILDRLTRSLNKKGFEDTPYYDT